MALQVVDQGCFGRAEFCGLDAHKKPFGDIGNAAFETHPGDLRMTGHAMYSIQRPIDLPKRTMWLSGMPRLRIIAGTSSSMPTSAGWPVDMPYPRYSART